MNHFGHDRFAMTNPKRWRVVRASTQFSQLLRAWHSKQSLRMMAVCSAIRSHCIIDSSQMSSLHKVNRDIYSLYVSCVSAKPPDENDPRAQSMKAAPKSTFMKEENISAMFLQCYVFMAVRIS